MANARANGYRRGLRTAAMWAITGAVLVGCGGGVDTDELSEAVRATANEDSELEDDFQEVSDCVEQEESTYECKVSGDDGDQFIDVTVIDGERFRVDEPDINTYFEGELP